jgi:2',3'-cyclic-nucleotide 2'-phosphodiesterase/3'-nucleotidase
MEHSARYFRSLDATGRAPQGGIFDPAIPGFNFDMLTGAEYTIDLSKPVGARITSLTVQGRAVSPSDTFTLALNNYRAGGGGGYTMLAGAPVVKSIDVDIRQLLIEEVERVAAAGKSFDPADYFVNNWRSNLSRRARPHLRSRHRPVFPVRIDDGSRHS